MNSASARASSVLPTPVGPRNRNEPIGRSGSCRPARERRSAVATASIASSWPTTRSCRRSSMWISFSVSPSSRRLTGMPVQRATTSATSSASTSSLRNTAARRRRAGSRPSPARTLGARALGRFVLCQLLLQLGDLAVAQLGGALQVGFALGPLGLGPGRLQALLELAHALDRLLLALPLGRHLGGALLQLGQLGLDRRAALAWRPRPSPFRARSARSPAASRAG